MRLAGCVILLVSLSLALSLPQGAEQENTSTELLTLFTNIAGFYNQKKYARNQQIDAQVHNIITLIQALLPETDSVHRLVHGVVAGIPLLHQNVVKPLNDVKVTLKEALVILNTCTNTLDDLTVDDDGSRSSHESQEIFHVDGVSLSNHHEVQPGTTLSTLLTPEHADESALAAILDQSDLNRFVTLNDVVNAFKIVAQRIAEEHKQRYLRLVPHIRNVTEVLQKIVSHVANTKEGAAVISKHGSTFYWESSAAVQELTNLTAKTLTVARTVC